MAMSSKKNNVSNVMFSKLARNNVRKNMRHYMIYFLTLMFSVAMLYTFNSIGSQFSMLNLEDRGSYLSFSTGMMAGVSVFISIILGFLVVYANKFLMRRRQKELGIYLTLGMRQKEISKLLFKETLIIGAGSLAAGIVLGIFLSQGLSLVTIKFLQIEGAKYRFVVSMQAIVECIVFYTLIFGFMNWRNNRTLTKHRLIDLLYADRKNEDIPVRKTSANFVILAAAVVCMAVSGRFALADGFNPKYLAAAVVLLLIGTFLFFQSIAGLLLFLLRKKKELYYQDLNMFAVHQISSKMNSTNQVLSVICILLFLAFTTIAAGLGMSVSISRGLQKMTSADAVIENLMDSGSYGEEEKSPVSGEESLKTWLTQQGFPLDELTADAREMKLYEEKGVSLKAFLLSGTPGREDILRDFYSDSNAGFYVIKLSEFNQLLAQQGKKPAVLSEGEFIINYNMSELDKTYQYYARNVSEPLIVNGHSLTLAANGIFQVPYQNGNVLADSGTLVVTDQTAEGLKPIKSILNCKYPDSSKKSERAFDEAFYDTVTTDAVRLTTKKLVLTDVTSSSMTLSYTAIYLGIIFLICACAVLALQQTANSIDNGGRYEVLRRLGAKEQSMKKALRMQIMVYFGTPLAVGLLYAAVAVKTVYSQMGNVPGSVIAQNVMFAIILFILIYGSYFWTTYVNSQNILKLDEK